jgi:hypothetical protein
MNNGAKRSNTGYKGLADISTFKPFPLTHYADVSVLDSSPMLGIVRDKSRVLKDI